MPSVVLDEASVKLPISALQKLDCDLFIFYQPSAFNSHATHLTEITFISKTFKILCSIRQIAFYRGNNREKLTILASFNKLVGHMRKFLEFRVGMGIVDNMVAKCKFKSVQFLFTSAINFSFLKCFQILPLWLDSTPCRCRSSRRTTHC